MSPRTFISTVKTSDDILASPMTYHDTDTDFSGVWAHPSDTVLVFTQGQYTAPFTYHNGPVGGISTPIQLILWGRWWTDTEEGRQRAQDVQRWTRALLDSHYFDELTQYHIAAKPVWRADALCVKEPGPPGTVSITEASDQMIEMIGDLIDNGDLPDPDDGPRIGFVVLMPSGFVCTDAFGAHYRGYDIDFPFDSDAYWAGWCRYVDPAVERVENMMQTVSHEIVEMLTDPEGDGWHTDVADDPLWELCDISQFVDSTGIVHGLGAWVNGVYVEPYYSAKHGACIVPIDRDYGVRLVGTVTEEARTPVNSGTFRPDPSDNAACSTSLPECCIEDRDYGWEQYSVTETIVVSLDTSRYRQPGARWFVNGQSVVGHDALTLTIDYDTFDGRDAVSTNGDVVIGYNEFGTQLVLTVADSVANFDLVVSCIVEEVDIDGTVVSSIPSTAAVTVGVNGTVLEVEQVYIDQRSSCLTAMLRRYTELHIVTGRNWRQQGLAYDPGLSDLVIPSYARVTQYEKAREALKAVVAANALLDEAHARSFIDGLIAENPVLAVAFNGR